MNYSMVLYILGHILKFESAFLLLPALTGLIYQESASFPYLFIALLCFLAGVVLTRKKPASRTLYTREGFVTVAMSWIVMSIFGALPFVLTREIPSYIDALFETISGFSTTGASILTDVEALSHASLFWRSFTHWVGGMGVFVFIMAILPLMGGSTMNLMKAESTGPAVNRLVPHVRDTAKILYGIYLSITAIELVLLCLFGMPLFDAFATSFATTGTGGFGIKNDSLGNYGPAIQNIVAFFMMFSSINYTFYFFVLSKKFREAFHMEEVRWYLIVLLAATGIISYDIRHLYGSMGETFRHAFFQVTSIFSSTGFSTADFDGWPSMSKTILVVLMVIGACAGSTCGGIKLSRIIILFKTLKKELSLIIHPREVRKIRLDGRVIAHDTLRSINVFMVIYFLLLFVSTLLVSIDEFDFTTNFTAVVSMLGNVGPGLDLVGPTRNFSIFSPFSKLVLIFDMLAGRLELFPMMVLLLPSTWKRK